MWKEGIWFWRKLEFSLRNFRLEELDIEGKSIRIYGEDMEVKGLSVREGFFSSDWILNLIL